MAAPTVYKSSDASAPVLTGSVGDLVNLLDKCLVSGYGSKVAAGWSKPYTSTNAAVFRGGGGTQPYVQVNDNAPGAGAGREARTSGWESMTAYNTGVNQFPNTIQSTGGIVVRKSATADATARAWVLVADDRTFYLFIKTGDDAATYLSYVFGDMISVKATDPYKILIAGRTVENSASLTQDHFGDMSPPTSAVISHYMCRNAAASAQSITVGKVGVPCINQNHLGGSLIYPNTPDAGLYVSPVYVFEPNTAGAVILRGRMRGFYQLLHAAGSLSDGDTFSGTGDYAGRTFLIVSLIASSSSGGTFPIAIETTAWDTSA